MRRVGINEWGERSHLRRCTRGFKCEPYGESVYNSHIPYIVNTLVLSTYKQLLVEASTNNIYVSRLEICLANT